jgi:hypothetical protein
LQFKKQVPFKCKNKNTSGFMQKEELFINTMFDPCQFLLDSTFKLGVLKGLAL